MSYPPEGDQSRSLDVGRSWLLDEVLLGPVVVKRRASEEQKMLTSYDEENWKLYDEELWAPAEDENIQPQPDEEKMLRLIEDPELPLRDVKNIYIIFPADETVEVISQTQIVLVVLGKATFKCTQNDVREDGVAEQTKASVAIRTGTGTIPWPRVAFFFRQVTMSGEQVPPSPTRAWQIPTGAH